MIQQSPTEERAREVLDQQINARRAPGMRTDLAFDNDKSVFVGDAIRAMIEFASQAAQPAEADGWVMVPRIMTEKMREVFHDRVRILVTPAKRECEITNDQELWELVLAATPKAPATDAGEVEAFATAQADHWLDDMQTPALGAKHVSLKAMAFNCINYGRALATPPAPNDDLRAALEGVRAWAASLPHIDMNEIVADNGITAGMVVGQEAAEQVRRIDRALKENRRG